MNICPTIALVFEFRHVNHERRARCDRVQKLHYLSHVQDDVLCQALDSGTYAWANVTSADVRLNRRLRGPCIQCLQGKFDDKSHPPSDSPPADCVSRLCIDTQSLTVKSPGGNQCFIDSVEEFSGDQQVTPAKSLSAAHLFESLMSLVYSRYNAYGHKITHILSDSLPAMEPLVPMLGALGIVLSLVPPGQHARRVEWYIGGAAGRRALLASLPYALPAKYSLHARQWIADMANSLPNSPSTPSCADILVTGRRRVIHYKVPDLCFGDRCLVSVFPDKRRSVSHSSEMYVKDVPHSELGVCLGFSRSSVDHYDFLLTNGEIVPRAVLERVQVTPFGWVSRSVLTADLAPPMPHPADLFISDAVQIPVQGGATVVLPGAMPSSDVVGPSFPTSPPSVPPVHDMVSSDPVPSAVPIEVPVPVRPFCSCSCFRLPPGV